MAALGGYYRRLNATGEWGLLSAMFATIAMLLVLGVPAFVIRNEVSRGAAQGSQILAGVIAAICAIALTSPILVLFVSCVLSGECL